MYQEWELEIIIIYHTEQVQGMGVTFIYSYISTPLIPLQIHCSAGIFKKQCMGFASFVYLHIFSCSERMHLIFRRARQENA